ncbi:MAG: hypothetical protein HY912_02770 [Desulfomonile tiedjei]|uniref:Uncharacterized protein n=1 Tax=Desulfomonile tiedjei TaxID=2358 RepID=A0A9D6V0F2_9BACT|nr:hypothetical protein [Desulfomonile tiedjei]
MKEKPKIKILGHKSRISVLIFAVLGAVFFSRAAFGETYGIKDPQGNFLPKVSVTVGNREVVIKKVDPSDKFKSFSVTLNPKNRNLVRNVGLIDLEWIDASNQAGRAVQFAGPLYNPNTRVFQDSLIKSLGLKLVDKTNRNLFGEKPASDLFTIHVDDQILVSSEVAAEKDRTVQLGTGRDVSLNIDKNSIVFNENNFKKGDILNVDNRSGLDQILGVELPDKGLLYYQVIRKPEQTKIPRENWERFTVAADSGIFIVLIPEPDPNQYALLEGKEITIKVFQGNKVRETRKIPIKIAADLRAMNRPARGDSAAPEELDRRTEAAPSRTADVPEVSAAGPRQATAVPSEPSRRNESRTSIWLWVLQIFNLVLLVGVAAFGFFFMLPKIQVLQDRLAKTEMFIHGSREAIREELDQIKEEIVQQSQRDNSAE